MITFPGSKINLGLRILGRRPQDGYHDLSTVMVPLPWTDVLEIVPSTSRTEGATLTVTGRHIDCLPEKNLAMKAYEAFCTAAGGRRQPVDIYLRKVVPDGAGLGGGSADAAAVLRLMRDFYRPEMTDAELRHIAASVGADCPFFLLRVPALATGVGTTLIPVELPSLKGMGIVVVKPQKGVSTKEAYAGVRPSATDVCLESVISQIPMSEWPNAGVVNDFEGSVFTLVPEIEDVKRRLAGMFHGAYVSMSGSGSAVYALVPRGEEAKVPKTRFEDCEVFTGVLDW